MRPGTGQEDDGRRRRGCEQKGCETRLRKDGRFILQNATIVMVGISEGEGGATLQVVDSFVSLLPPLPPFSFALFMLVCF